MKFTTTIFINLFYILSCSGFFIKYPFGPKFLIKEKEINKKIEYKLSKKEQNIVNKINGVYAIIGPDINIKNVSSIFNLFVGDGNIQSIFFNNGELTFVKHYIRTEKLLYEEENGRLPTDAASMFLFDVLNKLNLFPNVLGLANTAILAITNKSYALYERDKPYLIDIDFEKKEINTIKKMNIPAIHYFSGHSKFNKTIDTIDYHLNTNCVMYHELTENFTSIKNKSIGMEYLPIVHDFFKLNNKIIIADCPIVIDFRNFFQKSLPVVLDKKKRTIINILDKETMKLDR
jgi:hypothetical protein